MKLILSSCDFHEEAPRRVILEHLPKPIGECRVLFIPNEHASPETLRMDKYFRRLRQKGFSRGNCFVFDHTRAGDFANLAPDVVYISGGNTFQTLQKLRDTGFDRVITDMVRGGAVYIGGSAGAHIVSADLRHVAAWDALPEGFEEFSGLGLVEGVFVCHYCPEREDAFNALKNAGRRVWALRNEDSIVFENGEIVYDSSKE